MKRLLTASLSVAVSLGALPRSTHAQQNVAFEIHSRGTSVPAARIRLSFALNAPPSTTTTVQIGGATASLGGGWACVGLAVCPDPVTTDRFRLDPTTSLS